MSLERKISLMMNEPVSKELLIFLLVSLVIFAGFFVIYSSMVSLDYLINLSSSLPEKITVQQGMFNMKEFILSDFSQLIIATGGLVLVCLSLSVLSVTSIGRLKYLLIVPIFLSGILFNFSIMFLFFGAGLYIAFLYVVPLGETYFLELKKWKTFRVGSNAVGKGLLILFIFVFIGSYIALSADKHYGNEFYDGMENSISDIAVKEAIDISSQQNNSELSDQIIKDSMIDLKNKYPNLTDLQYSSMENELRQRLNDSRIAASSNDQTTALAKASLKSSPLITSMMVLFPLFFSFTLWATLEFLRNLFLSPISGIFSYILFKIPFFQDRIVDSYATKSLPAIEHRA